MSLRRQGRLHQTVAAQQSEIYWDYQPDQRVMTIDGPGRVIAVSDGPFPGSEEYEIQLEGGLGGGTYSPGQITAATSVEAVEHHTADQDYPELGSILYDRPDPATIRHTAELGSGGGDSGGGDGGSSPAPSSAEVASGDADEAHGAWAPEYNNALYHDWRIASSPDDDGDFDEDNMCAVGHEGTCEEVHGRPSFHEGSLHTAMPSQRYPEHPEGFETNVESAGTGSNSWDRALVGYIHGNRVGSIHYTPYDATGTPGASQEDTHGIKVNYLHTGDHDPNAAMHYNPRGEGKGVASAMMDHLYTKHPNALINHGYRTGEGIKWWNSYNEPNPAQNVHNLQPHAWKHLWDPEDVSSDINANEDKDPGHHSNEHDVDWALHGSAPEPHPAEDTLHHGLAVHLSPSDHRMVHDPSIPTHERAQRLLDVVGRGNMPDFNWHPGPIGATHAQNQAAHETPIVAPDSFGSPGRTHVVVHALPMHEDQTEDYEYDHGNNTIDFPSSPHGRKMELHGLSWNTPGGPSSHHNFLQHEPEPVGIAPDIRAEHLPIHSDHDRAVEDMRAHEERHQPRGHGTMIPPGTGEQMKLFSRKTSSTWIRPHDDDEEDLTDHLVNHHGQDRNFIGNAYDHHDRLHEEADDDDYMGSEPEGEPHEHHEMRDYHPQPWEGKNRAGGSSQEEEHRRFLAPGGGHDYKPVPRTIQSLNHLLVTAAMDPGFRFHVTAAWRDVQAKAKRIRKAGGVNITHASEGYVIANVQGDHHVYETGFQRVPGRRTAVAVYSCGCKWGAYHWGADDDMSRFAGRMCSHALALQYEAQARGMFGRDVTVDDTKPRWVPSKVVVKYDIDDGKNIQARSSLMVPEQAPLLAILALADDDDPGLGAVFAAVNDLFGDNSGVTEPTAIDPAGPTVPWNKEENPTSAGILAGGEPNNWGRINAPSMYPRLSSVVSTEAFWQRLSSILAGVETTLNEEPEPALPSTDGDDHTASLGDVDLTGGSGIGSMGDEDLSPEDPSIQTMGTHEIVAAFQRSAGAKHLMDSGKAGDTSNSDIAGAAAAYLQKTAASSTEFTLAEREALINENPGAQASNTDRLDIAGTHYAEIQKQLEDEDGDDAGWLY